MTLTPVAPDKTISDYEQLRRADILGRFGTFQLEPWQHDAIQSSRDRFAATAEFILDTTLPGREQSAALTSLEEAKYWTNQSIAKDGVPYVAPSDPKNLGRPEPTATDILALPIEQDDVPGITTLGGYLAELLVRVLDEEEGFDGKRPFGNSGWFSGIEDALQNGDAPTAIPYDDLRDAITVALTGGTK